MRFCRKSVVLGIAWIVVFPMIATTSSAATLSSADELLQERVQNALRSDPYFYDAHVDVSIEKGSVALRGIVFSDWDLRAAVRIARKAAGTTRVLDYLTIVATGLR